ncbi:MAG: RNA methyltransferase [Clostridia bacterium]|nr:RNA methyltransferase [Clostridia bacterium]
MKLTKIENFDAPELDVFVRLTGAQLRNKLEPEAGIFIAESPTVIEVALGAGCVPLALLTDERLINTAVARIINMLEDYSEKCGEDIPIYVAEREVLSSLTGFELTRGALCAMKRPALPSLDTLLTGATRVAVFENIADSTNIGALFRAAAALGIDAVLVTPTCCDPLCRRAVRVSMGTVMQVPWGRIGEKKEDWPHPGIDLLRERGFRTVAMALTDDSVSIDDPALRNEEKLAIILGTEGDGLSKRTIADCDYTAKIPMYHGVDSLNVASAGAVAFYALRDK